MREFCVRVRSLLGFAAGALIAVGASSSTAQVPGDVGAALDRLEAEVDQLQAQYGQAGQLGSRRGIAERFADGQVRYMLGQYGDAAIYFADVVASPGAEDLAFFDDARWALGDSLFLDRNYALAASYFEEIVASSNTRHGLDAARRLLEIAFLQGDIDRLDELFEQLQRQQGELGPEVAYVRGKALYFAERYAEANSAFAGVPADSDLYPRARYFLGVIQTRLGELEPGLASFDEVLTIAGEDDPQAVMNGESLIVLTHLARGRVLYELTRFDQAVEAYDAVDTNAPQFERALFEETWSLVRMERYRDALFNAEVLASIARDPRLVPEAQLLQGDLLMQLERYEEAVELYDEMLADYQPIDEQLRAILTEVDNPDEFFDALIDPENAALRLPVAARPWFEAEEEVARALTLVGDLQSIEEAIVDCRDVVDQLTTALTGTAGISLFPGMSEGWAHAVESENRLLALRSSLVDAEHRSLAGSLSSDAAARYAQLSGARQQLAAALADAPRTFDEIGAAPRERADQLGDTTLEIYGVESDIADQMREVTALREFLADQVADGTRSAEEAASMDAELLAIEEEFRIYRDSARSLRRESERFRITVGVTDVQGEHEDELRRQYMAAIESEAAFLRGQRPTGFADGARYDELQTQAARVGATLDTFFANTMQSISTQTSAVLVIVEQERRALDVYETQLIALQDDSEGVTGEAARSAFVTVQERFGGITMRANLGVLDVAWTRKETYSRRIGDLFEDRNRQLRLLDADFAEILSGE
jgi:tetratricopeptide (TPR) repeat protein